LNSPPPRVISAARERCNDLGLPRDLSAAAALRAACDDTLTILTRPFNAGRWLRLSLVCLFLGGGAPTAAFNWSWGTLLNESRFRIALDQFRRHLEAHLFLVVGAAVLCIGLALGLVYIRSVLRFVLVDLILKGGRSRLRQAYVEIRPLAHSYFLWLLGCLTLGVVLLTVGGIGGMRYLRSAVTPRGSVGLSISLVLIFAVLILGALITGILIALTDDLAVPIMYAERLTLLPAWRKLAGCLRGEPGAFATYLLVRFGISMLVGVVLLLFLFPLLLSLFSGSLVLAVVIVVIARFAGFAWVWNPVTLVLASAGLVLLTIIQLVLLSVIGMPGQILLQDYGMRFIGARVPSGRFEWRSSLALPD
jgi:hypothetical protein